MGVVVLGSTMIEFGDLGVYLHTESGYSLVGNSRKLQENFATNSRVLSMKAALSVSPLMGSFMKKMKSPKNLSGSAEL